MVKRRVELWILRDYLHRGRTLPLLGWMAHVSKFLAYREHFFPTPHLLRFSTTFLLVIGDHLPGWTVGQLVRSWLSTWTACSAIWMRPAASANPELQPFWISGIAMWNFGWARVCGVVWCGVYLDLNTWVECLLGLGAVETIDKNAPQVVNWTTSLQLNVVA